jgi:hypothetical protein
MKPHRFFWRLFCVCDWNHLSPGFRRGSVSPDQLKPTPLRQLCHGVPSVLLALRPFRERTTQIDTHIGTGDGCWRRATARRRPFDGIFPQKCPGSGGAVRGLTGCFDDSLRQAIRQCLRALVTIPEVSPQTLLSTRPRSKPSLKHAQVAAQHSPAAGHPAVPAGAGPGGGAAGGGGGADPGGAAGGPGGGGRRGGGVLRVRRRRRGRRRRHPPLRLRGLQPGLPPALPRPARRPRPPRGGGPPAAAAGAMPRAPAPRVFAHGSSPNFVPAPRENEIRCVRGDCPWPSWTRIESASPSRDGDVRSVIGCFSIIAASPQQIQARVFPPMFEFQTL